MNRKLKITGFTIVELLTVIAVLAILVGILMPALNLVKKMAKETKQKSQINSIDIGLNVFKNDQGDYPPSHGCNFSAGKCNSNNPDYGYCGAQTLTEALLGWDLLGYHPDSIFRADGRDKNNNELYPTVTGTTFDDSLKVRKGPYLERENISVFKPEDMYEPGDLGSLTPDKFVICDVFISNKTPAGQKYGKPVLYFRANLSAVNTTLVFGAGEVDQNIYNYYDNEAIVTADDSDNHKFEDGGCDPFYEYITDKTIYESSNIRRPVKPDTFLLISAGYDGLYGTADDICNFEPNFE